MPQGIPTDEETLAEFRARYLYSGNASAVGRELDIPERTARKIAERLDDDPSFAEDGRKLRARALDKLVAMRLRVAEMSLDRFESETGGIDVRQFGGEDESSVTITDKRHEYGKLVLEAEKNAQHLAKFDVDTKAGTAGQTQRIELVLTDGAAESSE
jgi:hypothetical protein